MIYVAMAGLLAVTILCVIQSLKIKRLVEALANTNASLNETRELVQKNQKLLKRVIKDI